MSVIKKHASPSRSSTFSAKSRRSAAIGQAIETLESRQMLSATLTLTNPDALPGSNRLIFNYIRNLDKNVPNVVHDTQSLTLSDTGSDPLVINSLTVDGPWQIVGAPTTPLTINPGTSQSLTLQFMQRSLPAHSVNETDAVQNPNGGAVVTGSLTIVSNDNTTPTQAVALAGYWQNQSENNSEPNLTTITNLLAGYDTTIANPYSLSLSNTTGTAYYGQEVVASSWAAFDPSQAVDIQQLASFHIEGSTVNTYWYSATSQASHQLLTSVPNQGQTLLPTQANGQLMSTSFTPGGTFGFRVDNEYSNDAINTANGENSGSSHHFRFYPLIDGHGNAVANTWIVAEDAGDYNYQDNVYVVSNMQPVTTPPAPTNLTATNGVNPVLSWTAETYPTLAGYNVYRATSATGTFSKLTTTPVTTASFTDTFSPPANTTVYYRVTAVDSLTSNESAPATVTANTSLTTPTSVAITVARSVSAYSGIGVAINLLAGDSDTGGTLLPNTLAVSTGPNHGGTVTINPTTGVATYTSTASFVGTETFSYTIQDSNGATSAPSQVTVTVSNLVLLPPVAQPLSANTLASTPVTLTPQALDSTGSVITPATVLLATAATATPASSITTPFGTATVNSDGTITYTPNGNFVGSDPFFYEVTDSHANASSLVPVDINVGVEINTAIRGGTRAVVYNDNRGNAATISLNKGIADIYFDGDGTAAAPKRGKLTVSGSGLTIHQIVLSNTTASSTLAISSYAKGNVTLGGIVDTAPLGNISARTSNLAPDTGVAPSGIINVAGVRSILLKSVSLGQITIGGAVGKPAAVTVTGAVDTSGLSSAVAVASLSVAGWTNKSFTSSQVPSAISAPSIGTLVCNGAFNANLTLTGAAKGAALNVARITGPVAAGTWNVTGNVRSVTLGSVTPGWAGASVSGNIAGLVVRSGLSSDIAAGSINSLVVTGALSANVTTTGNLLSLRASTLVGSFINVGSTATSAANASLENVGTATLRSLVLTSRAANAFSDSNIVANTIGSVTAGQIDPAGTNEGIAGHIIHAVAVTTAGKTARIPASALLTPTALSTYLSNKAITLGNFAIDIL
jgi:hypothetical protein